MRHSIFLMNINGFRVSSYINNGIGHQINKWYNQFKDRF